MLDIQDIKKLVFPIHKPPSRVHSFKLNNTSTSRHIASGTLIQTKSKPNLFTVHSLELHLNTYQPPPSPPTTMRLPIHLLLLTLLAPLSLTAPLPQPHLQLRQTTESTTEPTTEGTTTGSTTSDTGSILEEGLNLATTLAPEIIDLVKDFAGKMRV